MSIAHIIYIPLVLVVGVMLGYKMGVTAIRKELERRRKAGDDI